MDTTQQVRWGLFGLGKIVAARVVPALKDSTRCTLLACAAHTPERARAFGEQHGVPHVHASYADLLADPEVDAVYIATPNSMHYEHALAALRAGKHVLLEKPMAMTVAHGEELVRVAQQAGKLLRIAFQFRFEDLFGRVRELITQGTLGELRSITLYGASPVGPPPTWRQNAAEGGILADLGVHMLDLVRWMTGLEFTDVSARATPADMTRDPVQTITILGRVGSSCHSVIRVSREIPFGVNTLMVEGTHGSVIAPAWRNVPEYELIVSTAAGRNVEKIAPSPMFMWEFEAFGDAMRGEKTILATDADGVVNIRLTDAIAHSTLGNQGTVR